MPPLIDPSQGLMPSIVDRLIDPASAGTDARRGYNLPQMLEVVRRDLEDLLNTRQTNMGLPPQLTRVARSMMSYGLPDLTTFTVTSSAARDEMARKLESIIAQHEPRLKRRNRRCRWLRRWRRRQVAHPPAKRRRRLPSAP